MPFVPHVRISAIFSLGNPTPLESASCTLNFTQGYPFLSAEVRQDIVNDAMEDWRTWIASSEARVSQHVRLEMCKLWQIGTDGRATEDTVESTSGPQRGPTTAGKHPWQCSNVLTLVAGSRGKGRFGRIYLPPQCYDLDDNGTVYDAQHTTMFAATRTLLDSLSNRPGLDAGWGLAIAGTTGVAGTLRPVTEVRLGQVVDTQRRRRRDLPEAYSTAEFTA